EVREGGGGAVDPHAGAAVVVGGRRAVRLSGGDREAVQDSRVGDRRGGGHDVVAVVVRDAGGADVAREDRDVDGGIALRALRLGAVEASVDADAVLERDADGPVRDGGGLVGRGRDPDLVAGIGRGGRGGEAGEGVGPAAAVVRPRGGGVHVENAGRGGCRDHEHQGGGRQPRGGTHREASVL